MNLLSLGSSGFSNRANIFVDLNFHTIISYVIRIKFKVVLKEILRVLGWVPLIFP